MEIKMIRHIVMWKFADYAEGRDRAANMEYIKERLLALKPIIKEIRRIEIGIDILSTDMSFDMALITEFASLKDLEVYKKHPEHVKVSEYVAGVRVARAVVDCEIPD